MSMTKERLSVFCFFAVLLRRCLTHAENSETSENSSISSLNQTTLHYTTTRLDDQLHIKVTQTAAGNINLTLLG